MFNNHFLEFLELLEKKGVKYLVVGGYAVGFHGFPRYTGDLDIFIAVDPDNAGKLVQTFADFGFASLGLRKEDFLQPNMIVEIGREPMKIQVLTGIDGVTFDQCYQYRIYFKEVGLNIPVIGFDQLLKNKSATARGKDKIDVEELRKIKSGRKKPKSPSPKSRRPR